MPDDNATPKPACAAQADTCASACHAACHERAILLRRIAVLESHLSASAEAFRALYDEAVRD